MTAANDSTSGPPSDPQLKRIEAALANLGSEHQPPVGWQARVLAAVAEQPRRRPWWHFAMPAMLAVAVLLIAIGIVKPPKQTASEEIIARVDPRTGTRTRGNGIYTTDDVLTLDWPSNRAHRDVWVYLNDKRLFRCSESTACTFKSDSIRLVLPFEQIGEYEILAVASDDAISSSSQGFGNDQALLNGPNATVKTQSFTIR